VNPWLIGAVFISGLAAGWLTNGWRLSVDTERLQKEYALETAKAVTLARIAEQEAQKSIRKDLDQARSDYEQARSEIDNLRRNPVVVRVPIKPACLPENTGSSGSNEASAELTESARQDYLDLRLMMAEARQTCESAQATLKSCIKSGACY